MGLKRGFNMLTKTKPKIGPQDQGRKISLKTFEFAKVEEGYHYELSRGYVVVSEVPRYFHACLVVAVRDALIEYKLANPGQIHMILGSMDSKLLIPDLESERHPDLAVYLSRPKGPKDRKMWRTWIPDLVVEIVSPGSVERDYVQKNEEYWTLGVKEYWIVDAQLKKLTILKRGRVRWSKKELRENDVCASKLLPGFQLSCQTIFDAASQAHEEE